MGNDNQQVPVLLEGKGYSVFITEYKCLVYHRGNFIFALSRVTKGCNWEYKETQLSEKELLRLANGIRKSYLK